MDPSVVNLFNKVHKDTKSNVESRQHKVMTLNNDQQQTTEDKGYKYTVGNTEKHGALRWRDQASATECNGV